MNDADAPSLPVWRPQDGPGAVLQLIASGRAVTRGAIAEALGLSRSTVLDRLGLLIGAGLVRETEEVVSGRGRPSQVLRLDTKERLIIAVDIGEERTRVAVTDLGAEIRGERVERLELSDGPEALLSRVSAIAREVLADEGLSADKVVGLGLGLPAPVDYEAGQVQGWSIMSGWDGFDIRSALGRDWPVPVVIDNDAAMQKGVTIKAAMDNLNILIGSTWEQGFILFGQFFKVFVQAAPEFRRYPEDLDNMFVKNDRGGKVPYSSFMKLKKKQGMNEINRYNLYPSAAIQGAPASG
ncbi:MAG: ROK family protein, partial [Cellulomonas sp.]|nr:ROK family protein [Cellulomonas sp.]